MPTLDQTNIILESELEFKPYENTQPMQDVFPKFIIEDGNLILGKCTYHNQLATDRAKVNGGGMYRFEVSTNTFTLYGESQDFGRADLEDIQACFADGKVYSNMACTHSICDSANFQYQDIYGEIIKLK